MKTVLEKQIEKIYQCTNCGRTFRFARHTRACPYCLGKLVVKYTVKKEKNEKKKA